VLADYLSVRVNMYQNYLRQFRDSVISGGFVFFLLLVVSPPSLLGVLPMIVGGLLMLVSGLCWRFCFKSFAVSHPLCFKKTLSVLFLE